MTNVILAYCLYIPIMIILTIWVARTLYVNGKIFLLEIFHGNEELANSVNKLLQVGFYLVNFGYSVYTMTIQETVWDTSDVFEVLSRKIGLLILILGFWHFFNMYILFRGKKKSKENYLHQLQIDQMLKEKK
ncbi:MAG: hypothetical protein R2794_05605 [Chitinophagales bacterium]